TFVLRLNGLLEGEGSIEICGTQLNKGTLARIRTQVGLVFQEADEQLFMPTVLEDAAFGPLNLGLPQAEAIARAKKALDQVGMSGVMHKAPYHLSGGEKSRNPTTCVLAKEARSLVVW